MCDVCVRVCICASVHVYVHASVHVYVHAYVLGVDLCVEYADVEKANNDKIGLIT